MFYPDQSIKDRSPSEVKSGLASVQNGILSTYIGRIFFLWLVAFFLGGALARHSDARQFRIDPPDQLIEAIPLDLNLRVVWGGPQIASYNGTIEIDSGVLAGIRQLGIDQNDPSFLLKDQDGKILIDDRETQFGGCDIHVRAKGNSQLKIRIQTTDLETMKVISKETSLSIKSLRDNPESQDLGMNSCRLHINRVPGDRLRIVTSRSHLIYNSEEAMNIQVQPNGLPWHSTTGNLECTLIRLENGMQTFRKSKSVSLDGKGNGETIDFLAAAPKEEGVYELRYKLEPKRLLPAMNLRQSSIDRVVQFVVYNTTTTNWDAVDRHVSDDNALSRWRLQCHVPPKSFETESLTSQLLSQMDSSRRFPHFDFTKSFSVFSKESVVDPKLHKNTSQLHIPSDSLGASTINCLQPGEMHRLTVISTGKNAMYRVCLSTTGVRDSKPEADLIVDEVFDEDSTRSIDQILNPSSSPIDGKFEVLFWPKSRNAKLEITNLNASSALSVSSVMVDTWTESSDAHHLSPKRDDPFGNTLELHSANLRNLFGNDATPGSNKTPQVYDDWGIFLRFADQIGNYCNANAYDTLAMAVLNDGGSLFPSARFNANSRFDTGTFSSDGRDPFAKDVVELMYRAMSRKGVSFVPMLELGSPLREVEEAAINGNDNDLWQHRDGAKVNPRLYNPFSSRVQQAIATALDEFESRYRSHQNYQGFALKGTTPNHLALSLPIDQTNPSVLDKFASSVGGNLPKEIDKREQFISQRLPGVYSQWLRESITEFLGKLKSKPKWISVEDPLTTSQSQRSQLFIAPMGIQAQGPDYSQTRSLLSTQWNLDSPSPLHISMERPISRYDIDLARLAKMAKPFLFESARSLPYKDNSRTVSKVRIWFSEQSGRSLLISNSGAIAESIQLVWGNMPNHFQFVSNQEVKSSNSNERIETDAATSEWRMQIAPSEVIRIDFPDMSNLPFYWYSQDGMILRSLDLALQSLEQAVGRLSIPQSRVAALTNPSFESQNTTLRRGRLSGWTTSINAEALIDVDSQTATDGKSSIRIESKNASSIAWLQSDPFALTPADRLSISFQASSETVPQQVTLSLSKFDTRSDRFETIAVREFLDQIQPSKLQIHWASVGLDFSPEFQVASQGNEPALYRLQFEAKGKGQMWLDNFSVSTSFLRVSERRDLRSELFLARSSLQNSDTGPAVAMLTSPRGRLVQWGDALSTKPKVLVAIRTTDDSTDAGVPTSPTRLLSEEPRTDASGVETKRGPVKRLLNSWWSRKD